MICKMCGYNRNDPGATTCNLCGAVLTGFGATKPSPPDEGIFGADRGGSRARGAGKVVEEKPTSPTAPRKEQIVYAGDFAICYVFVREGEESGTHL